MKKFASNVANRGQIVPVHRSTRWSIHYRLQELSIPSACPADGTLRVDIDYPVSLMLLRSVVQQFTESRQSGINWLERCWQSKITCQTDS
ncbi:MAG: Asr1405/Asl0597 family protein [Cyanobacteria bacterium P01_D01_bin.14]